jgi:hypothetical protein
LIEDAPMRHGRKSRSRKSRSRKSRSRKSRSRLVDSRLVDGYKRHVLRDLDSGLICGVGVTPANVVEAAGAEQIRDDLAAQHATRAELFIDRAYLRPGLSETGPI